MLTTIMPRAETVPTHFNLLINCLTAVIRMYRVRFPVSQADTENVQAITII